MKVKKIIIKSEKKFNDELLDVARRLDSGRKAPRLRGTYFESLETVRNTLTEKRLELWRTIRDRKVGSISELAKMVKRDLKSIHRDLEILCTIGLVELKSAKGKRGDIKIPYSLADELQLMVA